MTTTTSTAPPPCDCIYSPPGAGAAFWACQTLPSNTYTDYQTCYDECCALLSTTTTTAGPSSPTTTTSSSGGGCANCGCSTEKYYGTVCSTTGYDHANGLAVGASIIIAGQGQWTYPVGGYEFGVAIDLAKPNCSTYVAVEFTPDDSAANPLTFTDVSPTENGNPHVMISSCCGYDCNNPT